MASTYSTNLAIELIGVGEQDNTWGVTTNTNLGTLIEQAVSGYVTQAITNGADTTITIPNGATGVARNMFIECTGALTAARNLIVPANKKLYFIYNNTTGGFAVTVKVSGQTGVSVPNGAKVLLVSNGTDVVVATNYMSSLSLGTALPVASGGTGATSSTGTGSVVLATGPTITNPAAVGTLTEDVFTITDAAGFAIDPTNGSIQLVTLGANRTPTQANWSAGQGVTLMINDGTAYTITWTTIGVTWVGGTAPTLATTGYTVVELWKVGTTVYGSLVGNVA